MSHLTNVGLLALAVIWWGAVVRYWWRLFVPWRVRLARRPYVYRTRVKVKRSIHAWHLILMGVAVAALGTEELVMQRLLGGWAGHDEFISAVVLVVILLGADRWRLLGRSVPEEIAEDEA
ncbi:hypothetical protein V2J56_09250 [Georgenia sp. MJ206]|uniref:hypothetical protein n=1 Tax=Georgenia wangjunii TaxID=3117730 RepID=UPI002F26343D